MEPQFIWDVLIPSMNGCTPLPTRLYRNRCTVSVPFPTHGRFSVICEGLSKRHAQICPKRGSLMLSVAIVVKYSVTSFPSIIQVMGPASPGHKTERVT